MKKKKKTVPWLYCPCGAETENQWGLCDDCTHGLDD